MNRARICGVHECLAASRYAKAARGMMIASVVALFAMMLMLSGCGREEEQASSANRQTESPEDSTVLPVENEAIARTPDQGAQIDPDTSVVLTQTDRSPASAEQWPAARFAGSGRIQPEPQRQGDPLAGRQALLEAAYVSCGLPERVFRQLLEGQQIMEIDARTDAAQGLPYSVNVIKNDRGQTIVSNNCLTCHATPLFGELVVGLGNEFLDFTGDASAQAERAGLLVDGPDEIASWELYADRIAAIAPYIRPHTVGVNPANNLTAALIAHRSADDNAWSDPPLLPLPPEDPPPVSVPPWWRMQKKTAMFNMGEGRGDHARLMMSASMLCTDSIEELEEIDAYAPDIRAFITSIEAPAWPFEIDTALVEQGQQLFEQTCSRCHGTYGESATYPSRLVPLEQIGTDPTLVEFAYGQGAAYVDWFNRSYYGLLATAAPGYGYVAPPLDGIWATAPFLHNGSVPSLRTLLDSGTRPAVWQHDVSDASDPDSYDELNMGWSFTVPEGGKSTATTPERVYDTSLPGYANTGHLFGDHLSDSERLAVLEYLKTL